MTYLLQDYYGLIAKARICCKGVVTKLSTGSHAMIQDTMSFLNIFLVWHPDFSDEGHSGNEIAEALYREFCRDSANPMAPAIGVPIYFRTSSAEGCAPEPIDLGAARHTMVVFLTDASMVLDKAYSDYAAELATRVANEPHARILSCRLPGIGSLPLGPTQSILLPATQPERMATLRLKIAAECCRLLQDHPQAADPEHRLSSAAAKLFISHAKRDARDIAHEIKAQVEDRGIDTFFDEAHIAPGYDFTSEIKENIKRSAVLAWQSDEYASRPWCNIELLTAKQHLRPIVVALSLTSGEERSFPFLGNVRTIVAGKDNITEIIIAVVREYLRKLYADGRFQILTAEGSVPRADTWLFRPPEPIDAALLESGGDRCVLYPDPPISTAESEILRRLFPHVCFTTPATADQESLQGMAVAISISKPEADAPAGLSAIHLHSAMIELARHILSRGGTLAYGGDLRERKVYGFTRQLFELVRAYKDLDRPPLARIKNFLAYHAAAELSKEEESMLQDLAEFEKILPDDMAKQFNLDIKKRVPVSGETPDEQYIRARCLTAMREAMVPKTHARVVLGGIVSGQQGIYPGILEESYLTLRAGKPLYVIGAFGGCARLVAQAIRDKSCPREFTREFQMNDRLAQLEASYKQYGAGANPINYEQCAGVLTGAAISGLNNGLSEDENRELFETPDLDRVVGLVIKGLSQRRPRP
jgi:hypothetical protein